MGRINPSCLIGSDIPYEVLTQLFNSLPFVRPIADSMIADDFSPAPSEEPDVPRSKRTNVFLDDSRKAIWTVFCNSEVALQQGAQQEISCDADGSISFLNHPRWNNAEDREFYRTILKMSILGLNIGFSRSVGFMIGMDYEIVLIYPTEGEKELSVKDYLRLLTEPSCFLISQ